MGELVKNLELCIEDSDEIQRRSRVYRLLHEADKADKEDFSSTVDYVVRYFNVSSELLAGEFGVSSGTISRWSEGRSLPPSGSFPLMVRRIAEYVK